MGDQIEIPFLDGMKVGLGYDALTGAANKSTAVTGDSLTAPAQAGGQKVKTSVEIIQEAGVLRRTLGVSVDASVGNLFGDASAKFKFSSDIAVNSFSLYVVIAVEVFNATLTLDNPLLAGEAADLLKKQNKDRFRERFGDGFILGIKTGGEYFAVYKVESLDSRERSSVASEIHARFGAPPVAGGSLDASIATAMERSKSKLNVNVYVFQAGGRDIETETTLQAIMDKATVFPTLVQSENAVPYSMLVHDYRELKLPGDGLTFADIQNQRDVLTFNAGLLAGFDAVVNDIDFIRKNLDDFKAADGTVADDQALGSMRRECLKQMDQIRLQMSKCSEDATACARIQSAPEDFSGRLPRVGASNRTVVPLLVGVEIVQRFLKIPQDALGKMNAPFNDLPLLFRDEFADLAYVANLAEADMHPAQVRGGVFVTEQDPPGGTAVSKGSTVTLKLRTGELA